MILTLRSGENGLCLDDSIGNLPDLWFGDIHPLHVAPWYGQEDGNTGLPLVERRLAGDFLCMPFGKSDIVSDPQHGFTSNAPWLVTDLSEGSARLDLSRPVMGACVTKVMDLVADAPLLYQTHVIEGGSGAVTLAHHPMIRLGQGGRLAFSPKRAALSPDQPLEPGRNWLPLRARGTDLTKFPGHDGTVDLTRYPEVPGHEDFLTLVEAPGRTLGWTAVLRDAEEDVVFFLKDPRVLPVTMLWYSNGGRDSAPWNGRHLGVLGVEDGIAAGAAGHSAALADNPVRREGVATVLSLGPKYVIRHVTGAIPRPEGWTRVVDISVHGNRLQISGDTGDSVVLPFRAGFL